MDEKPFFLSTATNVETESNETFFSSGLGLLRGLVFFWVLVWLERGFYFSCLPPPSHGHFLSRRVCSESSGL